MALKRGDPTAIRVGERAIVSGFPNYHYEDTPTVYRCRVSSIRPDPSGHKLLLLDRPIVYGMSGGPVMNEANEVIGIAKRGTKTLSVSEETEAHGAIVVTALDGLQQKIASRVKS